MAYLYAMSAVCVTIFSTGRKFLRDKTRGNVAAGYATEAISTICAVHIEDCEVGCLVVVQVAWWLSSGNLN